MLTPSSSTSPSSVPPEKRGTRPVTTPSSVDLPTPVGPETSTSSPSSTTRSTPSRTGGRVVVGEADARAARSRGHLLAAGTTGADGDRRAPAASRGRRAGRPAPMARASDADRREASSGWVGDAIWCSLIHQPMHADGEAGGDDGQLGPAPAVGAVAGALDAAPGAAQPGDRQRPRRGRASAAPGTRGRSCRGRRRCRRRCRPGRQHQGARRTTLARAWRRRRGRSRGCPCRRPARASARARPRAPAPGSGAADRRGRCPPPAAPARRAPGGRCRRTAAARVTATTSAVPIS